MLDAALDLLLGETCVGCARPGRLLCGDCRSGLHAPPYVAWPTPTPAGLAEPWAAAAYELAARSMVLGLKERGLLALARPLAELLATAAAAPVDAWTPGRPVVLVPVPSRRSTVRSRGHDPTASVTTLAARLLARSGRPVGVVRPLRLAQRVRDQSGLGAQDRAANLAGSMRCSPHVAARLRRTGAAVVVCDDVLTTGSTAREAQRALEAAGVPVLAVAVVAATRRRLPAAGRAPVGAPSTHGTISADHLPPSGPGH